MKISNTKELKDALRAGPYAWPGGYRTFFLAADCEALCHECVRSNFRLVVGEIKNPSRHDQWRVTDIDINYEDPHMCCAHCGAEIEDAYGD